MANRDAQDASHAASDEKFVREFEKLPDSIQSGIMLVATLQNVESKTALDVGQKKDIEIAILNLHMSVVQVEILEKLFEEYKKSPGKIGVTLATALSAGWQVKKERAARMLIMTELLK